MPEICPLIKEWEAEKLFLGLNELSTIIKEISQIAFPDLKELSLHQNKISSIEGLSRINMPLLRSLGFSKLKIMQARIM